MRKLTSAECADTQYRTGYNAAVDRANDGFRELRKQVDDLKDRINGYEHVVCSHAIELDAANARISAYRASEASRNEIFVSLSRKIEKSKEAVATLDSERAANAALTHYVEFLETQIAQLKENNGL